MNETREYDLKEVFHIDSPTRLDAQIARVSVLFEDLRIEIKEIEMLGTTEAKSDPAGHRANYFFRRSLATLNEFGDALTALDRNDDFKAVKDRFDKDARGTWSGALDHLGTLVGKKGKKQIITAIRDDIGGHFGEEAAFKSFQYAQQRGAGRGSLEIFANEDGLGGCILHFAKNIAWGAFARHAGGVEFEEWFTKMRAGILEAYQHSVMCVELIVGYYLWDLFK